MSRAEDGRAGADWRVRLRRLWQPRQPLFWLFVAFNALSSLSAWALRALPLSDGGLLLVGALGLMNAGFGLWAAWRLWQTAPADAAG